ncbi:MAG: transposase [Nodosilinea sp.]
MRELSKPSTAQYDQTLYTLVLLAEPKYMSCVRLTEILSEVSHDSVNRFLLRERYTPEDLFTEVQPQLEALHSVTRDTFKRIHDDHWKIECFHRVIKQVCNIERFYVRDKEAIRNHFFCALSAFCKLQTICIQRVTNNCYELSRQLFVPTMRQFILENLTEATFFDT